MNNQIIFYSLIYLTGVIISAISQLLLKKAAGNQEKSFLKQYLNKKVIIAYSLFFCATLLSVYAYKVIPLTLGAILGTLEYGLVAVLGYFFLKEELHRKQVIGLLIIIVGIIIYSV